MADTPVVPEPREPARNRRRRLGEMLVDAGILGPDQIEEALRRQKAEKGTRLGRLIVDLGFATETQICEVIADQLRIPAADMVAVDVPEDVLARVTRDMALKHTCLPWFVEGRDLYLIMGDPTNLAAADAVAFHCGLRIKPVVAPESEVLAAINRFYAGEEQSLAQFDNLDLADQLTMVAEQDIDLGEEDAAQAAMASAPLVKLVNAMLADAIQAGASDIHVEPHTKGVDLRYRVDGLLRKVMTMPRRVQTKVVSRIKIMAHLDISEKRRPQDGRTFVRVGSRGFDIRVSTLPTADGEKVVMRVLSPERVVTLDDLGFAPALLGQFKEALSRPQGMILVTGPTGSGKTSTLYAALGFLRSETTNIVTVEDPVEYRLPGISQVAVSDRAGLTFAAALRSILRQDPDVVMVGEIRDLETAQIAFQAAQTGHLVLSTLHTNDAAAAVTRLVEMGVPAYVVASSLLAVLAQRLVRRRCTCPAEASGPLKGCERCRYSGYRGRVGVYELMRMTPRARSVVLARGSEDVLRRASGAGGMTSMYQDGLAKVAQGMTTAEEVKRVVPPDDLEDDEASGQEEPPPIPLPSALSADAASRRQRVLVVDDDANLREVLADLLRAENFDVDLAADGEEALSLLHRNRPGLILTDMHMPRLDGLGLLRRVRADLATSQVPVIFLTIEGDGESEARLLDAGADDFVTKPLQRAPLLGRIRRAMVRAHLLRTGA
jgi:type IV pilus assembly protein PilB